MGYQNAAHKGYQKVTNSQLEENGSSAVGSRSAMQSMEILSGREYGKEFEERRTVGGLSQRWLIYGCIAFLLLIIVIAPQVHPYDDSKTSSPANSTDDAGSTAKEKKSNNKWVITSPPDAEDTVTFYDEICNVPKSFQVDAKGFTYLNLSSFCLPEDQIVSEAGCLCKNPVIPVPNAFYPPGLWEKTRQMNIELMNKAIVEYSELDVVFLGDSITERLNGRSSGESLPDYHNQSASFDKLFHKKNGGSMEGLALGISGDRCPNLLYRLQNGEMPKALDPKIWWILIGTNDLESENCGAQAITVGTIRIVEEIRNGYPNTPIVINSLFPRGSGELLHGNPTWKVMQVVNDQLDCYADTHANMWFLNTTHLFVYTDETKTEPGVYVNNTLLDDYIHPSGEGVTIWGHAIIKGIEEIIAAEP